MSSGDDDWQTMLDSLAVNADEDSGDDSDAVMEKNLSTPDGGAEDDGLIEGLDDAYQANLNAAPVMGDWTTDVQTSTLLPFDDRSAGVQSGVVLDCPEPVDFYELFMRGVWQLIVLQTSIYGKKKDPRWEKTNIEEMKQFLALYMQMTVANFPRIKHY